MTVKIPGLTITIGEKKTMIKLRADITVVEVAKAIACSASVRGKFFDTLCEDLQCGRITQDYPGSFYEQPPVGSFGKFCDENKDTYAWAYLAEISDGLFTGNSGLRWRNFTPGLPQDVDENGYPKDD